MSEYRLAFEVVWPGPIDELSLAFYDAFDGLVAEHDGRISVSVYVVGDSAVDAACSVIPALERLGLSIVRVDPDLVDSPEIASRLGVTRQAVNHWATGGRGSGFPRPIGSPGGKRIWTWGQITEWAHDNGRLSEPPSLTLDETTLVDVMLAGRRLSVGGSGTVAVEINWALRAASFKMSSPTRTAQDYSQHVVLQGIA